MLALLRLSFRIIVSAFATYFIKAVSEDDQSIARVTEYQVFTSQSSII